MPYNIQISPTALDDIQISLDYYNSKVENLGYRFVDEVDNSLQAIAKMPSAFGYRYKNVRAKQLYKFPFLIFFIVDENRLAINVLRVFNTNQEPFWMGDKP